MINIKSMEMQYMYIQYCHDTNDLFLIQIFSSVSESELTYVHTFGFARHKKQQEKNLLHNLTGVC